MRRFYCEQHQRGLLEAQGDGVQPGLQQCGAQHELSDERAQCGLGFPLLFCAVLNWVSRGKRHNGQTVARGCHFPADSLVPYGFYEI